MPANVSSLGMAWKIQPGGSSIARQPSVFCTKSPIHPHDGDRIASGDQYVKFARTGSRTGSGDIGQCLLSVRVSPKPILVELVGGLVTLGLTRPDSFADLIPSEQRRDPP